MDKLKSFSSYGFTSLGLLFLATILLESKAQLLLYLLALITGVLAFALGMSNNLEIKKLGLGITRKQIFKNYINGILAMFVITLSLLVFEFLFIYLIYKSVLDVSYQLLIFIYLTSLALSLVALLIVNLSANRKITITCLAVSLLFVVFCCLIAKLIIICLALLLFIIALYFINRYIIFHTDFKIK